MKTIIKRLFIILIISLFGIQASEGSDNYIPIRVGISDTNFKTYLYSNIEFNNPKELNIIDSPTGYTVPLNDNAKIIKITSENNLFRIYVDNELTAKNLSGPILVRAKEGSFISVNNLKRNGKQALYRGYIEIIRSEKNASKFALVNVLSLRNYLRGVVPNEMPVRFGLEALKAQTVAARNYALAPRVKSYSEFDVCDSVACQVYFGANTEEELSDKAIEQTNGILALDREYNPILALYSSTAGGYTEGYSYAFSDPATKAFPAQNLDYLIATPDKEDFESLETDEKAENFYTTKPEAFDDMSPYYRWSRDWTVNELEKVLSKTLIAQSKTGFIYPQLINESDFGHIQGIKVLQRGKSGKVIKLEIITDRQNFIVQKELVIRRCFQKNNISLPSANFIVSKIDSVNPVYKFSGGGFGHGVGMSQWGAGKMASLGYTYDEILQHYYNGIQLATVAVKIKGNNRVIDQLFYSTNEEAKIFIENPYNLNKLQITVNNKELDVKLKDNKVYVDISKYIKKGENQISYLIKDSDTDYTKYITASIIVKEAENDKK